MGQVRFDWYDNKIDPVIGCISQCKFRYLKRMIQWFHCRRSCSDPGFFSYRFKLLRTKETKRFLLNSLSDIADWKLSWAVETTLIIKENPQHKYLALTRKPSTYLAWPLFREKNVWCGFTVTNQDELNEVQSFINQIENANWFLHIELESSALQISENLLAQIKWIVVGAKKYSEGKKYPHLHKQIQEITRQAGLAGVSVFMKESLTGNVPDSDLKQVFPADLIV